MHCGICYEDADEGGNTLWEDDVEAYSFEGLIFAGPKAEQPD